MLQRTIKKQLPLDPRGIRFLTTDNDEVPLDLIMLTGLHSIWRSRMAGFHCDPDRRPARLYFRESIARFIEVEKTRECVPSWVAIVEPLATMKEF